MEKAKARRQGQIQVLAESEKALGLAVSKSMSGMAKSAAGAVKRQKMTLALTEAIISEIEHEISKEQLQLPMQPFAESIESVLDPSKLQEVKRKR